MSDGIRIELEGHCIKIYSTVEDVRKLGGQFAETKDCLSSCGTWGEADEGKTLFLSNGTNIFNYLGNKRLRWFPHHKVLYFLTVLLLFR